MVARGWSPSERTRIGFYLAVGLLLVLNPFLVQAYDLGESRYEYQAYDVKLTENDFHFEDRSRVFLLSGVSGVDCDYWSEPWHCYLEERVAPGDVTVDSIQYHQSPPSKYVHFDDGFYRRHVERDDESTTISYDPVTAEAVAANVSLDVESAPEPLAEAVRQGSATSLRRIEMGYLVRDGDRYYYAGRSGSTDGFTGRWALSFIGTLLGLAMLAEAGQLSFERQSRDE
ncbi:hypothetical protein [Halorientalis halophila]|uniref:hypothetical protein n=1 Tax=Halorientalis halophila TaxID=3108499 RepID=UPI0030095F37